MFVFEIITLYAFTPSISHFVNDHAHVLSHHEVQKLEKKLQRLEASDSTQVVILTIPNLDNETIEQFTQRMFRSYKIGQKNKNNGVLICLAKQDRMVRIEVGKGLEEKLTDLTSGRLIKEVMIPAFQKGDFDDGMEKGVDKLIQVIHGVYTNSSSDQQSFWNILLFIGLFLMIWIFAFRGRNRHPHKTSKGGNMLYCNLNHAKASFRVFLIHVRHIL